MEQEIRKTFEIGGWVYLRCTNPRTKELWYMPFKVRRVTPQFVFVEPDQGEYTEIRLKRRTLERLGYTVHSTKGLVFYVELPEEYKKTTIGYLWAQEPRAILGLPPNYTKEMLRDKYREFARKNHPDRGGDPQVFKKGQEAYDRLSEGMSLGDVLEMILRESRESDSSML